VNDAVLIYLAVILLAWVVPVIVASSLTAGKGRGGAVGFLLGLTIGWLGVAVAMLLEDHTRRRRAYRGGRGRSRRRY